MCLMCFFFQAEDGIRDRLVTGVQTCALPISDTSGESVRMGLSSADGSPNESLYKFACGERGDSEIGRASCRERV